MKDRLKASSFSPSVVFPPVGQTASSDAAGQHIAAAQAVGDTHALKLAGWDVSSFVKFSTPLKLDGSDSLQQSWSLPGCIRCIGQLTAQARWSQLWRLMGHGVTMLHGLAPSLLLTMLLQGWHQLQMLQSVGLTWMYSP